MNHEQQIREVLEKLFKDLGKETYGENYSIYQEAQHNLENIIVENDRTLDLEDEKDELEREINRLEEEIEELEDSCNCDCDKCKKAHSAN